MTFIDWGTRLADDETPTDNRVQELLSACNQSSSFEVVEIRRLATMPAPVDVIVVDAGDGTVVPGNPAGILRRERLALTFNPASAMPPEVRALRSDFPLTLHQFSVPPGEPRSLCLYEQGWPALERWWTAEKHLRQILHWLEGTADGTLHADDQQLEQLFYSTSVQVILPPDFAAIVNGKYPPVILERRGVANGLTVLRATHAVYSDSRTDDIPFRLVQVSVPPVSHVPIRVPAHTIGELNKQLESSGSTLLPALKEAIVQLAAVTGLSDGPEEPRVLLVLGVPRCRGDSIERIDIVGFVVHATLAGLGLAIGCLNQPTPGGRAFPFGELNIGSESGPFPTELHDLRIEPIEVRHGTSATFARRLSNVSEGTGDFRGILAGVGALGSAVANIWAREAWGSWTYVDPELLSPHNVVRHLGDDAAVGWPKAKIVEHLTNSVLTEQRGHVGVVGSATDFDSTELAAALNAAQIIVDASTTLEVPREFSRRDVPRVASIFLTPSGLSSVLLIEDIHRELRIADLEAQYYRAILRSEWGSSHLASNLPRYRTGTACRDRSFVLSQELILLHAGILARRLRLVSGEKVAAIHVWEIDDSTGAVAHNSASVSAVQVQTTGTWRVTWEEELIARLREFRKERLPAETGGVLVGVVDHKARTIHIVDGFSEPPDSKADNNSFTRGKFGVADCINRCSDMTGGAVEYVGEWHSHPGRCRANPSGTDVVLLAKLTGVLLNDGTPAIMLIVSESEVSVSLGTGMRGR